MLNSLFSSSGVNEGAGVGAMVITSVVVAVAWVEDGVVQQAVELSKQV